MQNSHKLPNMPSSSPRFSQSKCRDDLCRTFQTSWESLLRVHFLTPNLFRFSGMSFRNTNKALFLEPSTCFSFYIIWIPSKDACFQPLMNCSSSRNDLFVINQPFVGGGGGWRVAPAFYLWVGITHASFWLSASGQVTNTPLSLYTTKHKQGLDSSIYCTGLQKKNTGTNS